MTTDAQTAIEPGYEANYQTPQTLADKMHRLAAEIHADECGPWESGKRRELAQAALDAAPEGSALAILLQELIDNYFPEMDTFGLD